MSVRRRTCVPVALIDAHTHTGLPGYPWALFDKKLGGSVLPTRDQVVAYIKSYSERVFSKASHGSFKLDSRVVGVSRVDPPAPPRRAARASTGTVVVDDAANDSTSTAGGFTAVATRDDKVPVAPEPLVARRQLGAVNHRPFLVVRVVHGAVVVFSYFISCIVSTKRRCYSRQTSCVGQWRVSCALFAAASLCGAARA